MRHRTVRTLALTLVATAAAVGCGDFATEPDPTVGTEAPAPAPFFDDGELAASQNANPAPLALFENGPPGLGVAGVKETIGPEGGSVRLFDFEIVVPAGAVDEPTRFQIRLPGNPTSRERVMAEFGPHGAEFDVPVIVRFPLSGTTLEASDSPTVVWWNGSEWVPQPTATTDGGARIETATDHFSTFGTADSTSFAEMSSGG